MSELLEALIEQRRQEATSYQEYLENVKQLAKQIFQPTFRRYLSQLNCQLNWNK
ncbi:hypothetical protein [Planktothrix agardhii]|uniref:hypothetical protein n=1 Tax=Planktothrix agardhii TaxID=1160 RepID=UPI001D0BD5D2|nr:hypothetical protein [Planktothrix agardhii]MCB8788950.1 hypothetical protein [Planktothrix agardhii 1025]